ncbi:MAG: helix-turn-helix transcriptional regulator [Christensenellaceae bacterium]
MAVSYDKLWKLLIDRKMNRTNLKEAAGISFNVLAKMSKSELVSMESIAKICKALSCDVSDVMEFIQHDN